MTPLSNQRIYFILFLSWFLCIASCSKPKASIWDQSPQPASPPTSNSGNSPNILLILADDFGKDACPGYGIGSRKAMMPNLQTLMREGLVFDHVWATPLGAPTRAAILTGQYGIRTNVLGANEKIRLTEISLQKLLGDQTNYRNAMIGKWSLSGDSPSVYDPGRMGIEYFAGILKPNIDDYYDWQLVKDGIEKNSTAYVTTQLTDLAIEWITTQQNPWFLWLAYTAPATPYHVPPDSLHTQGNLSNDPTSIDIDPLPYYLAMIEAMDHEIGRLLQSLPPLVRKNTVIIFVGDNGTSKAVSQYPSKRGKGTLYEAGISVPMVIAGKDIKQNGRSRVTEIININDLFITIGQIAGINYGVYGDSRSFSQLLTEPGRDNRTYTYAEVKSLEITGWAIRNERFKLIEYENEQQELYDLISDPLELSNLLLTPLNDAASEAKVALEVRVQQLKLQ